MFESKICRFSQTKIERHDHFSALEWHFSADVVPYIYFYCVELFSVQRNVLDVLIDPAYDKTFSAVDVYRAQQRHFEIAHYRRIDDKLQKHVRFAIGHVVPRNRELNFRRTNFPFARKIERMRQIRDVVSESVVRIIVHRAIARQSQVERTHFCGAISSETATNNRDNRSATRSTDSNPRDSATH